LQKGKSCLDIGSGSGYLVLAFAKLMDPTKGICYGIEHIPELVSDSIKNIGKYNYFLCAEL